MKKLTIKEKILLHLLEYRKYTDRYEYPLEISQQGIANTIGISITHVPRNINSLVDEGLVYEEKGHVRGKKKRINVYFLTAHGIQKAMSIRETVLNENVVVNDSERKISELVKETSIPLLELIILIEKEGDLDLELLSPSKLKHKHVTFYEITPSVDGLVGREPVLKEMSSWYTSHVPVLVVRGPRGIGKTALVKAWLDRTKPRRNLLWLNIFNNRVMEDVMATIVKFLRDVYDKDVDTGKLFNLLEHSGSILVFDGYYLLDNDLVEFVQSLKDRLNHTKVIITMRDDTPFYNRFYTMKDIESGRIHEIRLKGLDFKSVEKLLSDVDTDAIKKIYQLTSGVPLALTCLKNGDEKTLREKSLLSSDQIRLLMFLRNLKKQS